jgi:hypothetical protein
MKRLIALTLAALTIVQPVLAATDPPLCGQSSPPAGCEPYQQFRTTSRLKRVAIVRMSRWDVLNQNNLGAIRRNMYHNLGNIRDAMRASGLEVHDYDTNFFELDHTGTTTNARDKREMWSNLGAKYALAIVLAGESNNNSRYVCADSTNVQLVVVGGGGNNGWRADTTVRGYVDTAPPTFEGVSANNGACLITYDQRDTVWGQRISSGTRINALPTGVTAVRRILHPKVLGGTEWASSSDSASWGDVQPASFDSTANARELLGPMWKVVFEKNLAEAVPSALNGVDGGGPRETYWIKWASQSVVGRAAPHFLWALVCRFTLADPIRWAYDWDDITDKFTDSKGEPPRWSAGQTDSALAALREFGIVPTMMLNPGHAEAYIRGDTPYTYKAGATLSSDTSLATGVRESAWSGPAHRYLTNYTWVHHSHDSTQKSIASNVIGGYGGYSSGNGANVTENGNVHQLWGYRYASRWNPNDSAAAPTARGYGTAGGRWGIVQRYAWSDSIRKVVAPGAKVPPYVVNPANQVLPKNWRARTPPTNWHSYASDAASCPIDSVLWAYDSMLVRGNGRDGRKLYIRDLLLSVRYEHYMHDRDSVVAYTIFLYPNERHTTRVSGRLIQAVGVRSFQQGVGPRTNYQNDAMDRAARLYGLKNNQPFNDVSNAAIGETNDYDTQGIFDGSSGYHDWNWRQSARVVYQHPGQNADHPGGAGDPHVDVFLRSIGQQMRAMDYIAGRKTQICVPGWSVYEKKGI